MKILFMGTPDFAVNTLEAIIEAGHEVVCVVTQPDKPRGRGKAMQFPPVKECAISHNLTVFQPNKVREPECVRQLEGYGADLIVVAAFGQILPKEILEMPKYDCMCVHASLLPRYRGAAPIQWALIDGEKTTGVTIMRMDVGIDTGDMMAKVEVTIEDTDTGGTVHDKLALAGASLCIEVIGQIEANTAHYEKQDDSLSCYASMLHKQLGNIDWSRTALEIERLIRGLNPWPSAYTYLHGKVLKIWSAEVGEDIEGIAPGVVGVASSQELVVQTGGGSLSLKEIQLEGKKRMMVEEFLRGYPMEQGTRFMS